MHKNEHLKYAQAKTMFPQLKRRKITTISCSGAELKQFSNPLREKDSFKWNNLRYASN